MALIDAKEHPGYSEFDRERFLSEPAKRAGRTEFARDRARIIHSFALRLKLQFRGRVIFLELDFLTL
jgi:dGTPase